MTAEHEHGTDAYVTLHGLQHHYLRWGDPEGDPVMLVHGLMNNARYWEQIAGMLRPDYTVYAPDLRGHGESEHAPGGYLVLGPVEVPLASRRLRESGTVLLRVLVDAQGLPRQITLHKSSGFARLDDQALAAMRQARFQVVNDNGSAIEWLVIAPLQYDVD